MSESRTVAGVQGLAMFCDVPDGLHQAFRMLAGEAEHRRNRIPAVVRVSIVQNVVENLAAVARGKLSVAKRRVAKLASRRIYRSTLR